MKHSPVVKCALLALCAVAMVCLSGAQAAQCRISLQPEIDAACAAGGGRVEVPAGEWLTGPVHLRSNVELHLSEGAVLEFSSNASEYLPTVQTSWQGHEIDGLSPLIYAKDCTNVSVTGGGRIKTDSAAWRRWHMEDSARRRPQFLQFFGCRDVRLEGFSVRGTPFWTIHIYRSEDVSISGLDVSAYGDDGFAINNSDGVDIECSRRVRVSDCSFRQNDDAIVLKSGRDEEGIRRGIPTEDVLIERCRVVSGPCMFAVGSEVGGGIRNVTMRDSTAGDSVGKLLFVKTNAKRGGFIENVLVENIRAKKVDGPLFWLLADYWYQPPPGVGNLHRTPIRGVTMRHVSAEEAESVLDLHGDSELPATGIVVEDVSVGTVLKNAVAVDNVKDLRIDGLKVANPPVVGPPPFDPSHRHQEADPPKAADVVQEALSRRFSSYAHIDMGEYMQELLVNRVAEMDRAADDAWAALKTPEDIAARRAELRERMIASVGGFPERTPLNVRKYAVHRRDGYVIENVVFESRPGHYVTAQFFVPANPAFKPPYPGVLVSCGHSKMGKAGQIYQRAAVVCAKHGFAALIFDPVDQGERQQLPGSGLMSVSGHVNAGLRAHLVGWGEAQFRLWDGIRALDLLASREDVDAKRLGVTGMSGGGTMSAYLNAVDWRFSAACPAGFLTSIRTLGDMCGPQDSEQVIHGQLAFGLNHLSLMLMNGGSALCPQFSYGDFFPYSGSIETIRKAMAFRRREGRSELIDYFDCAGPHHWYESEREAFCAWFARHLKGEVGAWPPDREALRRLDIGFSYDKVDTGLSGKPECEVLSGKGVMSLPGARSVYDLIADELARLERTRRPATPEAVARVAGIRMADAKSAKECARNAEERDGMKVVSAVLDMPDMARVPVVAFVPKQACGVPVVFAGDALNKAEYAPKVRELLAAGRAVAVVEMRGFGETGKTVRAPQWARRGADQELAAKLSWLGENLVARRAEDLLAAAEWFGGLVGGGKAELRAEGRAVVPAAHAYFVARERFAAFSSDRAPPSWTEMVRDTALTLSFAEVVYGGLKAYDWTDLVK